MIVKASRGRLFIIGENKLFYINAISFSKVKLINVNCGSFTYQNSKKY